MESSGNNRQFTSAAMTYDESNRMLTCNGEEIRYDADGNMTYGPLDGEMASFTYDCRNRLVQAGDTTYEYDAENVRIAAETPEYREEYTTDSITGLTRVLEIKRTYKEGGKDKETYYYGNGLIYEKDNNGDIFVYHYDHLGSTRAVTDGNGEITAEFSYGTYGELLTETTENPYFRFLYNGQLGVITDDNGLYYMRARYYNPDIKRFINQDILTGSITNSKSLNRYSYVEGNPVSYTDPFGLSPYTYANALGRLNGVVQGIGNMLSNVNWSTVLHAGLDILGSLPGGGVFNIANAALYGLEGNKEEAIKSLIYAIPGADLLGKATNYAVKGGKYAKEVLAITELATYAGYEMSAMLAAGDFGNDIAGMIDKYMTGEADLSIETAEDLLSLLGHAFQLNNFSSGFINVPRADFSVILEGKYEVKFADTDPVVMDGALGGTNTSWYNPDGSINYPPNNGAVPGTEVYMTLKPGDTLGRYGNIGDKSNFVTQTGADASKLALPPNTDPAIYQEFEVIKEIPGTIQAEIAPWGGSTGGGLQYELPRPILQLIKEGYIVPK